MAKKVVGWILVAFVVMYIVHSPAQAAVTTKNVGNDLTDMANGIGDFFTRLTE